MIIYIYINIICTYIYIYIYIFTHISSRQFKFSIRISHISHVWRHWRVGRPFPWAIHPFRGVGRGMPMCSQPIVSHSSWKTGATTAEGPCTPGFWIPGARSEDWHKHSSTSEMLNILITSLLIHNIYFNGRAIFRWQLHICRRRWPSSMMFPSLSAELPKVSKG